MLRLSQQHLYCQTAGGNRRKNFSVLCFLCVVQDHSEFLTMKQNLENSIYKTLKAIQCTPGTGRGDGRGGEGSVLRVGSWSSGQAPWAVAQGLVLRRAPSLVNALLLPP